MCAHEVFLPWRLLIPSTIVGLVACARPSAFSVAAEPTSALHAGGFAEIDPEARRAAVAGIDREIQEQIGSESPLDARASTDSSSGGSRGASDCESSWLCGKLTGSCQTTKTRCEVITFLVIAGTLACVFGVPMCLMRKRDQKYGQVPELSIASMPDEPGSRNSSKSTTGSVGSRAGSKESSASAEDSRATSKASAGSAESSRDQRPESQEWMAWLAACRSRSPPPSLPVTPSNASPWISQMPQQPRAREPPVTPHIGEVSPASTK